jgi:hypothetical protein
VPEVTADIVDGSGRRTYLSDRSCSTGISRVFERISGLTKKNALAPKVYRKTANVVMKPKFRNPARMVTMMLYP